jgi:pimeloyl-ACP methyl ester carboxylesterase
MQGSPGSRESESGRKTIWRSVRVGRRALDVLFLSASVFGLCMHIGLSYWKTVATLSSSHLTSFWICSSILLQTLLFLYWGEYQKFVPTVSVTGFVQLAFSVVIVIARIICIAAFAATPNEDAATGWSVVGIISPLMFLALSFFNNGDDIAYDITYSSSDSAVRFRRRTVCPLPRFRRSFLGGLLVLTMALILLITISVTVEATIVAASIPVPLFSGTLLTIPSLNSTASIHVKCAGDRAQGSPLYVVFGLRSVDSNSLLAFAATKSLRVCVFDRAGTAFVPLGPFVRSPVRLAFEVDAALTRLGEHPPNVFISRGVIGFNSTLAYAAVFPSKVAGAVFVDPPPYPQGHPDAVPSAAVLDAARIFAPLAYPRSALAFASGYGSPQQYFSAAETNSRWLEAISAFECSRSEVAACANLDAMYGLQVVSGNVTSQRPVSSSRLPIVVLSLGYRNARGQAFAYAQTLSANGTVVECSRCDRDVLSTGAQWLVDNVLLRFEDGRWQRS